MSEVNNDITYLGRTFKTSLSKPLTDEEYEEIVRSIRSKVDISEAHNELMKIHHGSTRMGKVTDYYLKDVLYKARNGQDAWSVDEALRSKKVMEYFNAKISVNDRVYPPTLSKAQNILTAFRLCGIRCCRKLPNFPMKTIDELLETYLPEGGNYYDYSCGWASRLVNDTNRVAKIYSCGSEEFIPEMENTIDFAFSSPPYFTLELYNIGKQSCDENTDYNSWLENYMKPTVENIHKYLKDDGFFAINIKDIVINKTNYYLTEDINRIIEESGKFEFQRTHELKNIKRTFGSRYWDKHESGLSDKCDELIYVYKKRV